MKKTMKNIGITLMSSMALLALPNVVSAESMETETKASDEFNLTIFHTNDIHANINDFGKLSYFLNSEREKLDNSLYFDAGDSFSGNPVVDLKDGIPMIELFNAVELDLFTVGNHEFDYGQEAFRDRRNESNFDWLSANMDASGSAIIEEAKDYKIFDFEKEGVKLGVIGLTQAPPATAPSGLKGLHFNPYYETVQKFEHLRDEVDILVALNHIGLEADKKLAEQTDIFDVIIGGHSHTTLDKPVISNGTMITQSGSRAKNVGVVDLKLDKTSKEVSVSGRLESLRDMTKDQVDPSVQRIIDKHVKESEELLNQKIGETKNELNRDARWEKDVSLGNLITDALRSYANTDLAITNNGGIRASIEAGDITKGDIFTVDPFDNRVTVAEMTGRELKEVLKYSFHRSEDDYGRQVDLQTSGLNYTIITEEPAEGEQFGKYVDIEMTIGGKEVDLDKTYTLATNNFIITGGDGYDFSKANIVEEDNGAVTDALMTYIENAGVLDYKDTEGRIQVEVAKKEQKWQKVDGQWFLYENGEMQTGWEKVNGKWYYMNNSGAMQTGWEKVNGKWYYMSNSGAMQTGWKKLNGSWYYMNNSGAMQTDWTKDNGKWYYIHSNGRMLTGWREIEGSRYYMNGSGEMETGWTKIGEDWYYMQANGRMQTGWNKISGKWHYMDGRGIWQK